MTDYPRCKTCKWWGKQLDYTTGLLTDCDPWRRDGDQFAPCGKMEQLNHEADNNDRYAIVHYDRGESRLYTGRDFGCVLHEPKQD